MAIDSNTSHPYWYNTVTGEVNWNDPREMKRGRDGIHGPSTEVGNYAPPRTTPSSYDAHGRYVGKTAANIARKKSGKWYYRDDAETTHGPYPTKTMLHWLQIGYMNGDVQVLFHVSYLFLFTLTSSYFILGPSRCAKLWGVLSQNCHE